MKPPSAQIGGTLSHFLPATIRRPVVDKKKQAASFEFEEVMSPDTSLLTSNSTPMITDSVEDNMEKEERVEEGKRPPPIPPKLTHTTSLGGLDVMTMTTPPKIPPRSNSPKLESLPVSYLTYRHPKHHRQPPEIPNNDITQPPPRPPRVKDHSPVTPPTPNNDSGLFPPIPALLRRSHSPSHSNRSRSPPPRPPPPAKSNSPSEKDNSQIVFNYDSTPPPILPPKPSSFQTKESAPPIPPKSNR